MYVTRWGRKEAPLSQFPGWGIEIMMGLYGEQSVRSAIAAEKPSATSAMPATQAADADGRNTSNHEVTPLPHVDPVQNDMDAVSGMFRWLQRRRG